jgi:hypothetical protein
VQAPARAERLTLAGPLSTGAAQAYLTQLSPFLVERGLSPDELTRLRLEGGAALEPILTGWTQEAGFAQAARHLLSNLLAVGGARDGIDFELPGNLAAYTAAHQLPWATVLTADFCVDAAGARRACDTGSPFSGGGVLNTRAYLTSRASRFNLTRASTLLRAFACRGYPMEDGLQPRLPAASLIPLFQKNDDASAGSGFGNGTACYTCHGQFSAHAQLFVKFDATGLWREAATGQQDPTGELGRSTGGLMTSHLLDAAGAKSEVSQFFGRPVQHLGEAASVLAHSEPFAQCQVRQLLAYATGLQKLDAIDDALVQEVALRATDLQRHAPTLTELVLETFLDGRVQKAILDGVGAPP